MKKIFTIALLLGASTVYSQGTAGLVAHWDMNGTVNDVSGNGHDGTAHNIVPAVGLDGVMGTAYYFDGSTSYISVPYAPSLNLTNYSICAKIKVMGFYNGNCQCNVIITRGPALAGATGCWAMAFDDNASDGDNCAAFDSTQEVFYGTSGPLAPSPLSQRVYSPAVEEGVWYKLVVTFNDTVFKTYINGVLINTAPISTPGAAIGTSSDSISIGYDIMEAMSGYPYPFKGLIDDISVYNRVLSDTDVTAYTTSVQSISNESSVHIYPNPAHSEITIQNGENSTLDVFNVLGQKIYSATINNKVQSFDISEFINGLYFVQVVGIDGNKKCIRLLKE